MMQNSENGKRKRRYRFINDRVLLEARRGTKINPKPLSLQKDVH